MSLFERVGRHSEASLVGAPDVSFGRPYTFFRINFPPGMDCTKIQCRSGQLLLVARWNGGNELDWVDAETETEREVKRKVKRLDEDPSHGSLRLVGAISDDGRIFLHERLVANGNREQAEAYCRRLVQSLSGD